MPARFSTVAVSIAALLALSAPPAVAQDEQEPPPEGEQAEQGSNAQTDTSARRPECGALPGHGSIRDALREVVDPGNPEANGGLGNHMWAVVVNRAGIICTVAFTGEELGDQWPGSRGIAAAKAHSANGFSLPGFALSTANLFWPAQPQNSLYGLETSHPVETDALYGGPAALWGTQDDPLIGTRMGGVTLFGGGMALYTSDGALIGALGVSGDKSCTDHVIAWKVRHLLNLDNVPDGVSPTGDDNIIFDLTVNPANGRLESSSGYGHPSCGPAAERIAGRFGDTFPVGPEE